MGSIDPERMPNCEMARVIVHWTAGGYTASALDRQHYHILIQGDGTLAYGVHSISANARPAREPRASHTRNCNTGSIGVAVCAMREARERPFSAGPSPMTQAQWEAMADVVAELCLRYGIDVTPRTVLAHGEVERVLGIPQRQKWDPLVQPWSTSTSRVEVMDGFRALVRQRIQSPPPPPLGRGARETASTTAASAPGPASPFAPQSQTWPGDSAVLLVHGVGNAGAGDNAGIEATVKAALGGHTAVYSLFYDIFNDWFLEKMQFPEQLGRILSFVRDQQEDDDELAETAAEFVGDVVWPIFSLASRIAVQRAYTAQLRRMILDGVESTNGTIPVRDLKLSIICHSLGCFHTYELLHAAATDQSIGLRPGTEGVKFRSVVFMASPVRLIRTLATPLGALVPSGLFTTGGTGLSLPSETVFNIPTASVKRCVTLTGDLDPIGGHFLRKKADWAYMSFAPGSTDVVDQQHLAGGGSLRDELFRILRLARSETRPPQLSIENPHSWSGYIDRHKSDLTLWLA